MKELELLAKFIRKKVRRRKILLIISFILLWIFSGFSMWTFNIPYLVLGGFQLVLGILLITWLYSIRLRDIYNSTIIDQLGYQYRILLYIKDSTLVKAIKNRDLTSNKTEEINFITNLIKSLSTVESSILISGILKKEGFTNYIPNNERDINED